MMPTMGGRVAYGDPPASALRGGKAGAKHAYQAARFEQPISLPKW